MNRVLLAGFVLLLLSPSPVYAQTVSVTVQVILASREVGGRIDPAIASLVQELRRDLAYTSYQLLETQRGQVTPRRSWRTSISGGLTLSISLLQAEGRRVELQIKTAGVNTRVSLQRGGSPFLVGGPPHHSGVLIIAISAR
ncbi:MAG: hypothetical protein ACE5I9_07375 [Candidatus Methylomirabilales bacterium]